MTKSVQLGQGKTRGNPLGVLSLAVVLGLACCVGMRLTASPAPFGSPLPVPQPRIVSADVAFDKADFLGARIPPAYLEFLAPQPDGTPPLRYPYASTRGGFSISHPMGAELTQMPGGEFSRDAVDAIVQVHYNQPLILVKYTLPVRRDSEKVTEFMARMRFEMEQLGWKVTAGALAPLEFPRYRFERLEFLAQPAQADEAQAGKAGPPAGGTEARFWYVGPLGDRLLMVEFAAKPENVELARRQAEKVMASFKPSYDLALVMLEEDPAYGEWAGTSNVALAEERRQKRAVAKQKFEKPRK